LVAKIQESNLPEVKKPDFKPVIVIFDPNKSTYDELIGYGFTRFQASNVTEYKRKGGIFKAPADLLKIYGIDSVFFKSIEPYIQINFTENQIQVEIKKEVILVELNSADSANLVKLEGIGNVLAKRILKYRDLLGGFYSKKQLTEVYGISEEVLKIIEPNIVVDTMKIQKLRLNFFEFKELMKHPYLNKKQVESVLKYREKKGSFTQISQVRSEGLLDEETYNRILPYLTCR
jgi:DNA uptake protein ComE-like DNA-binding protein